MNVVLRRFLLCSSLVAAVCAPTVRAADAAPAAAPAPAVAEPIMIANLTESVPGLDAYSTWKENFNVVAGAGVLIQGNKGAQGSGGIYRNIQPTIDLSKAKVIDVALVVQSANEVPEFTVALNDADGTQYGTRIRVGQIMPGKLVWFRLKLSDFTPISGQGGSNPKMEWNKIGQWHLQGDWNTKKPAHVQFAVLLAR